MKTWDDMDFWQTGEWQVIQERLDDFDKLGISYNPSRENLFASLDATAFGSVKVVFMGQDPYPKAKDATGLAFSIPPGEGFPPTLKIMFDELVSDLHVEYPEDGDLQSWADQGVLLWNATPTCNTGMPGSHSHWSEWYLLTGEIIQKLDNIQETKPVFVLIGGKARGFSKYIFNSPIIEVAHPSPLARNAKNNFTGSRVFSRTNAELVKLGQTPIDWRL